MVDEVDIAKNADDVSGKNEATTEKFVVDDKEFILSFDQLRKRMFPIRSDNKILKRVCNYFCLRIFKSCLTLI